MDNITNLLPTKGLSMADKKKLILLCQNADSVAIAKGILDSMPHLSKEQKKEVVCISTVLNMVKYGFLQDNLDDVDRSIIADLEFFAKLLGYQGRKLVTRNGKLYAQMFCGRSKPSFELYLKDVEK